MLAALSLLGVFASNSTGLAAASSVARPTIAFDTLSVSQALHFSSTVQDGFGYVTKVTIGSVTPKTLNADLTLKNPVTGFTAPTNSVGAMGYFSWSGGMADPITVHMDVSAMNSNILKAYYAGKANVPVQLSMAIFQYDQISQRWYATIGSSAPVALTGTTSNLAVAALPDDKVTSPMVYQVSFTLYPNPTTQQIPYRYAPTSLLLKPW